MILLLGYVTYDHRGWRGSHNSGANNRKKKTKIYPITFGAWNVRTLLDNSQANRPQRRSALVGRELGRYNVDIAALSETRLAEEGQLKEIGAGNTFFWSGRASDERRESGVGFAVKNELVSKLSSLPQGINVPEASSSRSQTGNYHQCLCTHNDKS